VAAFSFKKPSLLIIGWLIASSCLSSLSLAARYDLKIIESGTGNAINNAGRVVGVDNGQAVYWIVPGTSNTPMSESFPLAIELKDEITSENKTILDSVATGINDTNDPDNAEGELVTGWFSTVIQENGIEKKVRRPVVWQRDTAGIYIARELPIYQRIMPLCNEPTEDQKNIPPRGVCILTEQDLSDRELPIDTTNLTLPDDCGIDYTTRLISEGVVTDCKDTEAIATNVNDNGFIIGTSFDENGAERPVYWVLLETGGSNAAKYQAGDLSLFLETSEDGTQEIINRKAEVLAIDKNDNTITGSLISDNGTRQPIAWLGVSQRGYEVREFLESPLGIETVSNTVSGNRFAGWTFSQIKQDENGNPILDSNNNVTFEQTDTPIPIRWQSDSNLANQRLNCVTNTPNEDCDFIIYTGIIMPTLADKGGQIIAKNTSTFVGTSINANDERRATIYDFSCNLQNLNDLVITNTDFILEQATAITHSNKIVNAENINARPILGKGISNGIEKTFVLVPVSIDITLDVKVKADHNKLIVGQKHTYSITVTNNSPENHYATCVRVKFETAVFVGFDDNGEPDKRTGGMTYLSVNRESICDLRAKVINCLINKLEAGSSVSIDILTQPRPLLADRDIIATATVRWTETDDRENKQISSEQSTHVEREGCFIATVAFGSYLHPQVITFREFRDHYLASSQLGQWMINQYYHHSPALAEWISDKPLMKSIVRPILELIAYSITYPLIIISLLLSLSFLLTYYKRYNKTNKKIE